MCGVSVYSVHRDEKIWVSPYTFRPERFLSEDGTRVINKDKIIPFGYGRTQSLLKELQNVDSSGNIG